MILLLRVDHCCCFALLRGTLIILWSTFVCSFWYMVVLAIIRDAADEKVVYTMGFCLMFTVTSCMGLYGVYKEEPNFLKPFIIVNLIVIVLLVILIPYQVYCILSRPSLPEGYQNKTKSDDRFHILFVDECSNMATILNIFYISAALPLWYFTTVVFSCYLKMLEAIEIDHGSFTGSFSENATSTRESWLRQT